MNRFRRHLLVASIALGAVLGVRWVMAAIDATPPPPCSGNVCTNIVNVGGQDVQYWWTRNQSAGVGSLKIRFRSGPYTADPNPVSFKISVTQPFATYTSLKNPSPTASLPPTQNVDVLSTWIMRSAGAATNGTVYDFVQELRYDAATAGQIDVTIELIQYGAIAARGIVEVPKQSVNVDATATDNRNEGTAFPADYGAGYKQCGDGVDNDIDYRLDCADSDCLGKTIQDSPLAICEASESSCYDARDNDGDGLLDCADPQCNGRPGLPDLSADCGPENGGVNHANCADAFDNDNNGKSDCWDDGIPSAYGAGTGCWKTGFQSCVAAENTDALCTDNVDNDRDSNYAETTDAFPATGVDCKDYECKCEDAACAAVRHCAINERDQWTGASFTDVPGQCSDGVDNDLDGDADCADIDCLSHVTCAQYEAWLPPSPLGTGESTSTPAKYFNFCADGIDNDGDASMDGADSDCKNVFGECSPAGAIGLASVETVNFLSCSDTFDNDLDTGIDCNDAECRADGAVGKRGCVTDTCGNKYLTFETDAAQCLAVEADAVACGDGLDNDGDTTLDCSDPGCVGQTHGSALGNLPAGYVCSVNEAGAQCADGYDNDADGNTDCFDTVCQNGIQCAQRPPAGWTVAACSNVPEWTALAPIAPGGFIQYSHLHHIFINTPYKVRFAGPGSYTSLTIVLGDAVVAANNFPFDPAAANCVLSGVGAAQMQYVSSSPGTGLIIERSGQTISDFDVTLTCANSSAVPVGPDSYSIALVANRSGVVEFGEVGAAVQVFETSPPVLPDPAVDAEGIFLGEVDIPAGQPVRLQAKPNNDPSGICRCEFDVNGAFVSGYVNSIDGNCVATTPAFTRDDTITLTASAVDGAGNRSATSTPQNISINIVPSVSRNLTLASSRTTYKGGQAIGLDATFQTDAGSDFSSAVCKVYLCGDGLTGCALQGPAVAPMVPSFPDTYKVTCLGSYTPPVALSGGRYWLFVEVEDSSNDFVRSNIQSFLKCEDPDVGTGACRDADFDNDGVPEGRVTPNASLPAPGPDYPPSGAASSCDNCVNYPNASQIDKNANGIGDSCEASNIGRCRYKQCSGSGDPCADDADCASPDRCIVVDQQMCTVNCTVANEATDCALTGPIRNGVCIVDWGTCETGPDAGQCCFNNGDCTSGSCKALVQPFIETISGQVYSGGDITAGEQSPIANATFCLQAAGVITNFSSDRGCALPSSPTLAIPKAENNYANAFGILDVKGIEKGKYGPPQSGVTILSPNFDLDGKIYTYDSGLTIGSDVTFRNSSGAARANGLIVVYGDLTIDGDVEYQDQNVSDLKNLASVGWLILRHPTTCVGLTGPNCGNVIVNGNVKKLVGAIFAEGDISTGVSSTQLDVNGILVAKSIAFQRQFASRTGGSERVRFDARVILNPPPGMSDVSRSLPGFQSVPGQ